MNPKELFNQFWDWYVLIFGVVLMLGTLVSTIKMMYNYIKKEDGNDSPRIN